MLDGSRSCALTDCSPGRSSSLSSVRVCSPLTKDLTLPAYLTTCLLKRQPSNHLLPLPKTPLSEITIHHLLNIPIHDYLIAPLLSQSLCVHFFIRPISTFLSSTLQLQVLLFIFTLTLLWYVTRSLNFTVVLRISNSLQLM